MKRNCGTVLGCLIVTMVAFSSLAWGQSRRSAIGAATKPGSQASSSTTSGVTLSLSDSPQVKRSVIPSRKFPVRRTSGQSAKPQQARPAPFKPAGDQSLPLTASDNAAAKVAQLPETGMPEITETVATLDGIGCDSCGGGCGSCRAGGCSSCCDDCWLGYRGCGGLTFEMEALLIAYHRADGMRVGTDPFEHINSKFNLAPRVTVGYTGKDGTGVRVRWFDYNHNERTVADVPGEFLSVDTFNIDVELFDQIRLNRNWGLELSGGWRMNNFAEFMYDFPVGENEIRANWFDGQGGVVGIEARRDFCLGSLYGGLRGSILLGDHTVLDDADGVIKLGDVVQSIWEIGAGYEASWKLKNGSVAYIRVGGEWQQWQNFSSEFDTGVFEFDFDGTSDVGFGGFTFAFGYVR